jgi:hypothetical protein
MRRIHELHRREEPPDPGILLHWQHVELEADALQPAQAMRGQELGNLARVSEGQDVLEGGLRLRALQAPTHQHQGRPIPGDHQPGILDRAGKEEQVCRLEYEDRLGIIAGDQPCLKSGDPIIKFRARCEFHRYRNLPAPWAQSEA